MIRHRVVVVQIAVIRWYPDEPTHVLRLSHLFARNQRLESFLAVTRTDDLYWNTATKDLLERSSEVLHSAGGSLLDEDVALLSLGERVQHEIDRLLQ